MNTPTAVEVDGVNAPSEPPRYRLRLYITGATSRSTQAIENIKAIGEKHLSGRYDLEVVDAYQQTDLIRQEQIVVLPTLVKQLPLPSRRMIGDLSDEEQVLIGLGLVPEDLDDAVPTK